MKLQNSLVCAKAFIKDSLRQCARLVKAFGTKLVQDPQEGEIEKLGLGWKAERAIMVLSVTKIDQLMKRTLVTLTLGC